jgi:transposase
MLTSRFRLSRRQLSEFFSDLLDVPPPSLGSTQAFREEVAAALLGPYQQIRQVVRGSALTWVDETGWSLRGQSRWTWVAVAPAATLFRIGRNRSTRSRELLLGRDFRGVLTSDRWRAYDSHPLEKRQPCWAHLKRIAEAKGPVLDWEAGASRRPGDSSGSGISISVVRSRGPSCAVPWCRYACAYDGCSGARWSVKTAVIAG